MVADDTNGTIDRYSDFSSTDYNDDEYANINIYWNLHNLVYSKGELWTTCFVKYVIPYLSGGRLGNARTAPGCIYRPRVSLDSFACTF